MKTGKPLVKLLLFVFTLTMLFSTAAFANDHDRDVKDNIKDERNGIIVVGDSRVMYMAYNPKENGKSDPRKNYCFVFGNGYGIHDFKNNRGGIRTDLVNEMKKHPKATVVFMLGVNYNIKTTDSARLKMYDDFMSGYKKRRFIVSTVGKTVGRSGNYGNARIRDFNSKIQSHYAKKGIAVYDLYAYTNRIITDIRHTRKNDGLHYDDSKIDLILKNLRSFVY